MKTPESPSEITVGWLDDMLVPEIFNNEIESIEIDKKFGPWSGLGKVVRVKLMCPTEKCEPKSVIVKFQISNSDKKNESEIYRLLADTNASYVPRLYGVFGEGHLVLEDLSPTHSNLSKENFTIVQARSVISLLADVNSRFWGDPRVPKIDLSHFINSININFGESWEIFKNRFQDQLGELVHDFEWMREHAEVISRHYNSGPIALSHGDVNNGNLLFPIGGCDKPILIDWQLSGHKVLPFDLSYFMVKQLSVGQRRQFEDVLLKEYYGLLPAHIQSGFSFERFVLDYRACATRSMLSAVTRMGPKFENMPNRYEEAGRLAIRVIEAVKDLKPLEALRELEGQGLFI
jgi:hypothetical protein